MIDQLGLGRPRGAVTTPGSADTGEHVEPHQHQDDLDLRPVSRWPTMLAQGTVKAMARRPLPPADRETLLPLDRTPAWSS